MTFLSIVLPVHNVQGYLGECLDSLLRQSFTDFEVVAVDDRSSDHSGAILDEYAARDPRVKIMTLAENVGPGRARNAGLAQTTGTYVWFVDSDDWVATGALAAVADRLRDTDADVLLVGFDRVDWDGTVATRNADVLAAAPQLFALASWPRVLHLLHVAWNKVVRRDLLVKGGFQFAPGWYEDVSFSYPLLVAADRISTLARICVHYRQRRTGAITRTVDDRHFEIFERWAQALSLVDAYPERAEAIRPLLFRRMIWHYVTVLRNPDRVPPTSRRRFFARMHREYHRYLPAGGYPPLPGTEGMRQRLVGRGDYPALWALELVVRAVWAGRRTAERAARLARRLRRGALHVYYLAQLRRPVDPSLALFAAYWFRGVACNPAAIAAKTAELAPGIRRVWVVHRDRVGAVPPGTDYVRAGSRAYFRALARARWLVNNVNWPNQVVKRPGSTHVMTHHGTPLKMMGADQIGHPPGRGDADVGAQLRRADRWDVSVSANAHTTVAWDRAYPCGYESLEVGYPRNDRLAVATATDTATVRAKLGLHPTHRVVLYAPTHRDWRPAGEPVLDVDELARRLGSDTVLLVRAHYFQVPPSAGRAPVRRGGLVDVSAYPVVEDLYLAADVLVTDYSSAMFDFAVLDRPVVIHAPDWAAYRELRGVYFDLLARPPGAVAGTDAELFEIFETGAYADGPATAARADFRAQFCYLDDGGAAERVVRRVMLCQVAA
jgi:CDP-glycerol glycerophosphotransferase